MYYTPLGLAGQLFAALRVPVGDGNGLPNSPSGMLMRKGCIAAEAPPPPARSLMRPGDTSRTFGAAESRPSSTSD